MSVARIWNTLFLLAGLVVFAACGKSKSNPARDYSNLKLVKPHGQTTPEQTTVSETFAIDFVNEQNEPVNDVYFVQGKANRVNLKVRIMLPSVQDYRIALETIPDGATLQRSTQNPDIWHFDWTPRSDFVPDREDSKEQKIDLTVIPTKTDDGVLAPNIGTKSLRIIVKREHIVPEINDVVGLPKDRELEEGEIYPFSVTVTDAGSNKQPTLEFFSPTRFGRNKEKHVVSGESFIEADPSKEAVENLGAGKWRFNQIFTTKNRTVPTPLTAQGAVDTKADGVHAQFSFRAKSVTTRESVTKTETIKILFLPKSPEITWGSDDEKFAAGVTRTISFKVKSPNKRGTVKVENKSVGFEQWPGGPKLDCVADPRNPSETVCDLVWQPLCQDQTLKATYKFSIVATTLLEQDLGNGQTKQVTSKPSTLSKTISVEKFNDQCERPIASPRPPAVKSQAPAKTQAPASRPAAPSAAVKAPAATKPATPSKPATPAPSTKTAPKASAAQKPTAPKKEEAPKKQEAPQSKASDTKPSAQTQVKTSSNQTPAGSQVAPKASSAGSTKTQAPAQATSPKTETPAAKPSATKKSSSQKPTVKKQTKTPPKKIKKIPETESTASVQSGDQK